MMTLEERIERLERTNRRYRRMFTLLGVVAVCAVGISATQDDKVPDVIQAKAFEVVDDEGTKFVEIKLRNSSLGSGGLISMNTKGAQGLVTIRSSANPDFLGSPTDSDAPDRNHGSITIASPKSSHMLMLGSGTLHVVGNLRNDDVIKSGKSGIVVSLGVHQGAGSLELGDGEGTYDTIRLSGNTGGLLARGIGVLDDKNNLLVTIQSAEIGEQSVGIIATRSSEGVELVQLTVMETENEEILSGGIVTKDLAGRAVVSMGADVSGSGLITTRNKEGQRLVQLGATPDGGHIAVINKTGEQVCGMAVDEYGNGVIAVMDRNGKGRTLKPGP